MSDVLWPCSVWWPRWSRMVNKSCSNYWASRECHRPTCIGTLLNACAVVPGLSLHTHTNTHTCLCLYTNKHIGVHMYSSSLVCTHATFGDSHKHMHATNGTLQIIYINVYIYVYHFNKHFQSHSTWTTPYTNTYTQACHTKQVRPICSGTVYPSRSLAPYCQSTRNGASCHVFIRPLQMCCWHCRQTGGGGPRDTRETLLLTFNPLKSGPSSLPIHLQKHCFKGAVNRWGTLFLICLRNHSSSCIMTTVCKTQGRRSHNVISDLDYRIGCLSTPPMWAFPGSSAPVGCSINQKCSTFAKTKLLFFFSVEMLYFEIQFQF